MKFPRLLRERGVAAVAVILVLAFAISQFQGDGPASADAPEPVAETVGQSGLRAVIDPETGALATGTEASRLLADKMMNEELRQMLSRSDEGLVQVVHPDGRVSVDLQGRFMNASVARIGQDGRLEQTCVESAAEAEHFLNGEDAAAQGAPDAGEVR